MRNTGSSATTITKVGVESESGSGEIIVEEEVEGESRISINGDESETSYPDIASSNDKITLEVYADGSVVASSCAANC